MTRRKASRSDDKPAADLTGLEAALGYSFHNPALLAQALTHSSAAASRDQSNERLEFLGDRVLGLTVAGLLLETFPDEDEGQISYRFSALVMSPTLARVAAAVGLPPHVRRSEGEQAAGGRDNPTLLANCCEAVIAAIYLDGGLEAAQAFVRRHWRGLMDEAAEPPKDAKTLLQEWAQAQGLPLPRYRIAGQKGPGHAPLFLVEVAVQDRPPAEAEGPSKRAAEQAAAALMLRRLGAET